MAFNDKDASYRALIYFKDGNQRTFYSWDFAYKGSKIRNPDLGKKRLHKMILEKFRRTHQTALIIDNISGEQIEKYVEGVKRELHEE